MFESKYVAPEQNKLMTVSWQERPSFLLTDLVNWRLPADSALDKWKKKQMESTTISVRPPFCLTTIVPSRLCGGSYPRPQALSPRKYQMCRDIFRSDRTPLILVWAKNMQPSNVSGMDGRASAISKHVPQGNILLLGQTRYYAPEETSCLFRWRIHSQQSHTH